MLVRPRADVLHGNSAITFDLEAVRRANLGYKVLRFRAMAADTAGRVRLRRYLGSSRRKKAVSMSADQQYQWRFVGSGSIRDKDHFLTLAATDGGDGIHMDWIIFGDPRLELVPVEQK